MNAPLHPTDRAPPNAWAGGIFVALLPLIGACVGGLQGEPVIGLLVGLAVGVIAALVVWAIDRTRKADR